MKKLLQVAAVTLACVGMAAGVAAADSNNINTIINNTTNSNCNNNVNINTSNLQNAQSGNTNVTGNTQGGGAISGSASNYNNSTFNVQTSCGTLASSTTPPATGGKGAGATTTATTPTVQAVTVSGTLPETGSNLSAIIAVASVIVAGVVLLASRLGIATYRRLTV